MVPELIAAKLAPLKVAGITSEEGQLILELRPTTPGARCPRCKTASSRVHSRYVRRPRDLAWANIPVQWQLQVRRFRCDEMSCSQRIFSEQFPQVLAPWARRAARLTQSLGQIALALGGEAGARLSQRLGLPSSAKTLLRIVRRLPLPLVSAPRAVGIDEWAWRKGRRYGTIMVDLESHRVLALLADYSSEQVAQWLRAHPTIEVISRDRAGPLATGATAGAPQATQVADRFHLLQNLGEVVKRVLERHSRLLDEVRRYSAIESSNLPPADPQVVAESLLPPTETPFPSVPAQEASSPAPPPRQSRQQARHLRYAEAKRLKEAGMKHAQIARHLGVARTTVLDWLRRADYPVHPGAKRVGRPLGSKLDPYKPYLQQRFGEGCETASLLWREIQAQGFAGSDSLVKKFIATLRDSSQVPTIACLKRNPRYSTADLVTFILRRPQGRSTEQQALLARLQQVAPVLHTTCELADGFATLLRERQVDALAGWLAQAEQGQVGEFHTFATGLRRDEAAVRAALSLPWSSGVVEGHVNRLKFIKRSMYGRANFDLLQRRVLLAT